MTGETVFLLKGYPRLSETFIAQEIRALEKPRHNPLGNLERCAFRPTSIGIRFIDEIKAPVTYLPEYLYQEPRGSGVAGARSALPGFAACVPAMAERSVPRSDAQSRPPLRPGLRAGGRKCRPDTVRGCMRISCTRRRRSPITPI